MEGKTRPELELRLLGSVQARWGGVVLDLGAAKPKSLLAALVLHAGKTLPKDTVIEAVWDRDPLGTPPGSPVAAPDSTSCSPWPNRLRPGSSPGTVVISAIDGMGGVGKSALAVRAARRHLVAG